jgi:hypothetical protein
LAAGHVHSLQAATYSARRADPEIVNQLSALRWFAIVGKVPCGDLPPLENTPMANVVRDPREHPEVIIPDLTTNTVAKFTRDQVAFVYGASGSNVTLRKSATTTSHSLRNGKSKIMHGANTLCVRARTGGRHTILLTT